jgi:ribosome-associated protein YbcJ (S4-like RNA binding protein)
LKKKGKRKEETIDLDECLKIKGLRDNRGEARMLLKAKAVIALVP